jgi:hypothetical protein
MSRRFNPVSAGVAAVTATVILGVAGCAMGTRTETTDQTDSAGLSREANMNSQAPVPDDTSSTMPSTTAMDTPATSSTSVALPAEPAPVAAPMANDTAAIPPADTSQPMASTSTYPSDTASTSSTTAVNTTPSTSSSTTSSTTSSTDMSGSSNSSSYSSLPPRTDRN